MQILLGQALTVWTRTGPVHAVVSRKAPHLLTSEERNKVPQFSDVWIDVTLGSEHSRAARLARHELSGPRPSASAGAHDGTVSPMDAVYDEPLHPYTRLLIACLPSLEQKGVFAGIPGLPSSLLNPPPGCPFNPRCPHAMDRCRVERPVLQEVRSDRWVACHLYDEGDHVDGVA